MSGQAKAGTPLSRESEALAERLASGDPAERLALLEHVLDRDDALVIVRAFELVQMERLAGHLMLPRAAKEARGVPALERLVRIAHADHGQACRVRRFLLGLYNGQTFPFDLTDLRSLDQPVQEDCLAVLAMDIDGPSQEVHNRIPGTSEVIAEWAAVAWPDSDE
jgi:hypothetical protein